MSHEALILLGAFGAFLVLCFVFSSGADVVPGISKKDQLEDKKRQDAERIQDEIRRRIAWYGEEVKS